MHTKEPWIVTGTERIKYIEARIGNGFLQEIASCMIVEHGNHEDNARRIVACVNACAGIPIETLEKASCSIPAKSSLNGYFELKQQRDELLAALKYVLEDEPNLIPRASASCREVIKAVIAKADLTQ